MKTTAILFAVATALVANEVAAIEKCNYSVVAPQLHSLGPEVTACYEATGYYLAPPPGPPTAEQQAGICSKCTAFINKVKPMQWPDCWLNLAGTEQTITKFFNGITSPCEKPAPIVTSAAPVSSAPATTKPTVTTTPTVTSATPVSNGPAPATTAPAPATTAPNRC